MKTLFIVILFCSSLAQAKAIKVGTINIGMLDAVSDPASSYEPSQRVDHIFLCGKKNSWDVLATKQIFHKPIAQPQLGHPIHLSDHYGVSSEIEL